KWATVPFQERKRSMIQLPKWLLGILALALVVGLSTPVLAEEKSQTTETAKGKIQKISADQNQLVLRDARGNDWGFHIGRGAKVRLNDKDVTLAELKEGDEVTVNYRLMAQDINADLGKQATDIATGRIQKVMADQNQFILRDRNNRDWTFQLNPDAKVRLNDK